MAKINKEYEDELNKITQKLFNKNYKDVKWCMVTNYVHTQLIESEDCLRTGLYSWIPVMNGEVKQFQDMEKSDYEKYDIIHVNLSGQDVHILGDIREILGKDSKTKLVANNDYTVELWQNSFDYLTTMGRELKHADMLFGTEPNQVGSMEMLTGVKIHNIVHPCFVKRLKTLQPTQTPDRLSVVWHRYDNYSAVPSLAIKDLGLKTCLIGYDPNSDPKKFVTSCNFNSVLPGTNYLDFCDQLMTNKVVVDPFTLTSQSRTGWDCAAMGLFMVGSDRNYSVQKCYPFTMCSPFDAKRMRELVKRGLNDAEFRKKVIDYAKNAVEYVNYDNSRLKYFKALEEGSPKIEL